MWFTVYTLTSRSSEYELMFNTQAKPKCVDEETLSRTQHSPLEPVLRNYLLSGPEQDAVAPTGNGAGRAVQILAFVLALLGVLGITVATLLPNWKVSNNVWSSVMTPISQMQGLWMDCVWYSSGVFSCTMKNSVLSLPAYLQTTRVAMVLSCMLASFGLCLASLGLKCTRWGGSHRAKGHTAIAAGGCFVLASFLCLVPASWFTNEVITAFLTTDLPDNSKYQPGGALCVTFVSAGFLLAGGVIFCLSCPGKRTRRPDCASPSDPDRFVLCRDEQRRRELQTEREQPTNRQNKSVQLQLDKVKHKKPPQEKPELNQQQKLYSSPSKPPPKDIKDSYSLQEYV
ncbi:Claudin-20 [Channa argus]|uniref:Claudin-20 n=1 Tax=Channa argus TaxID=215402 RepID=A0A6G1QLJ6_CHAAH|nr:Claudin-20 [Channa argus]